MLAVFGARDAPLRQAWALCLTTLVALAAHCSPCDGCTPATDLRTPRLHGHGISDCEVVPNIMPFFNVEKLFMRRWYEVLASGSSDLTRCHKTEVVPSWEDSDGDYDDTSLPDAKAKLSFFDIGKRAERNWTALLYYAVERVSNGGKFGMSLSGMMYAKVLDETGKQRGILNFMPIATDYENYLVAKLCGIPMEATSDTSRIGMAVEQLVVLAESRSLSRQYLSVVGDAVEKAGYATSALVESVQTGCRGSHHGVGCPNVPLVEDFDLTQYAGSWHVVMSTNNLDLSFECETHVISTASGTVSYFEKLYNKVADRYETKQGSVEEIAPAKFTVVGHGQGPGEGTDYWVVDTDYTNFAIIMDCVSSGGDPIVSLQVLSRSFQLSSTARLRVQKLLNATKLANFADLDVRDVADCVPDTCPPPTTTQQGFDPRQASGLWYEVSRLGAAPAAPCVSLTLTPAPNGSLFALREELETSEPVEQAQFVELPDVEPSQNPVPGRTRIRLSEARPVDQLAYDGRYFVRRLNGVADKLNILATDYENWALISVCEPQDGGRPVRMYTAVMSRDKAGAGVLYDEVSKAVEKHDMDYSAFTATRSPQCPKAPCVLSIPVEEDLEWKKLEGPWYAIQETPAEGVTGFCSTHSFKVKANGNSMSLRVYEYDPLQNDFSSRNFDLRPQARYSNSKFNVTPITPFSKDVFLKYWILSTDYKNYLVAHSCSDEDGGRSKARAWVLSRTPGLDWETAANVTSALVRGLVDMRGLREVDRPSEYCQTGAGRGQGPTDLDHSAAISLAPSTAAVCFSAALVLARAQQGL